MPDIPNCDPKDREEFEAWAKGRGIKCHPPYGEPSRGRRYRNEMTQVFYNIWLAARRNTVPVQEVRELVNQVLGVPSSLTTGRATELLAEAKNKAAALQAKIGGQRE